MRQRLKFWLAATAFGAAFGTAHAASLDLGKLFDAGRDVATAAKGVDEKEEIEIGREVAGRMLGAAPLVNDPELQAYVNRVGRWVALQAERPDLPWRFGVLDNPAVNAFASPGGYVLITRGLYEMLDSEAQLAGVLGHEIGHIVQRHHITVMQKSAAISAGANLAQASGRGSVLRSHLIGTGAEIFARGLDKSAEFEADRIGVILAARAGYSPYGLVEVLHKLAARSANDASLALLFKTHPQPGERLTQLGEALEPRVATLPAGKEPVIRQVSADVPPPATAAKPVPAAGARALRESEPAEPPVTTDSKGRIGVDPASLLKGLFGR
ncbi:MAG: M48 family metalloprotease [Betaproteobacteria bacterium]|nr:M48 family metalloprotease [Betaproteobacteria bacterium]